MALISNRKPGSLVTSPYVMKAKDYIGMRLEMSVRCNWLTCWLSFLAWASFPCSWPTTDILWNWTKTRVPKALLRVWRKVRGWRGEDGHSIPVRVQLQLCSKARLSSGFHRISPKVILFQQQPLYLEHHWWAVVASGTVSALICSSWGSRIGFIQKTTGFHGRGNSEQSRKQALERPTGFLLAWG